MKLGAISIISILMLYSCHLAHKVDALAADNEKLVENNKYISGYITKYADLSKENQAMTETLTKQMQNVKNDPRCPAPDSFKHVIKQLRK